jgi:hypothetical protein
MKRRYFYLILSGILILLSACEKDQRSFAPFHFGFETGQDLDFLKMRCHSRFCLSDSFARSGSSSLKTVFYAGTAPVLEFAHFNTDWRNIKALRLYFYNPAPRDTCRLLLYIDDIWDSASYDDRFNYYMKLPPGATGITIPTDSLITTGTQRPLQLKTIYRLIIHGRRLKQPLTLFLDDFYVE